MRRPHRREHILSNSGYVLLRIAQEAGDITHEALAEEMGISLRSVADIIKEHRDNRALLVEGTKRNRRYVINEAYRDERGFAVAHLARLLDIGPATEAARRRGNATGSTWQ